MNREELIKQRDKIQAELDRLTELINKPVGRWKPEYGGYYYYLASNGNIIKADWANLEGDYFRFGTGNCFRTEQEARDYKENLLTEQRLKDLAVELNNGVEVNWNDGTQNKYGIVYSNKKSRLEFSPNAMWQELGRIYCLDIRFLEIAKQRIGEERITKLIKSGV